MCGFEQLKPQSLDVGVWGSSLAGCIVCLDRELNSTLCLFTQVYLGTVDILLESNPEID